MLARVKEILEYTTQDSWRHCPGVQNPADLPSHGMSAKELVNEKRWWKGPEFLYKSEAEWPQEVEIKETKSCMNEVVKNSKEVIHSLATTNSSTKSGELFSNANIEAVIDCTKYNSKSKLVRVTALVLQAVRKMKRMKDDANEDKELTAENLKEVEQLWLKSIQLSSFAEEFRILNSSHKSPNQLINQLNLFLDVTKIIR